MTSEVKRNTHTSGVQALRARDTGTRDAACLIVRCHVGRARRSTPHIPEPSRKVYLYPEFATMSAYLTTFTVRIVLDRRRLPDLVIVLRHVEVFGIVERILDHQIVKLQFEIL